MAIDFTVVSAVRQRFGDDKPDRNQSETERESTTLAEESAPFVGAEKSFPFDCPNVDRTQWAVLLFESYGVTRRQAMQINNQTVHGGIPEDVELNTTEFQSGTRRTATARWNGSIKLIHPDVLRPTGNVLRISTSPAYGVFENLDDFIVDNIVVVFKTAGRGGFLGVGGIDATARRKRTPKKRAARKPAKRRR